MPSVGTLSLWYQVSPGRDKSTSEQAPLVASHHGSDELTSSQELPLLGGTAAMPDFDSLHYFGVFDGHGGADAARHCAQRMHQVSHLTEASWHHQVSH